MKTLLLFALISFLPYTTAIRIGMFMKDNCTGEYVTLDAPCGQCVNAGNLYSSTWVWLDGTVPPGSTQEAYSSQPGDVCAIHLGTVNAGDCFKGELQTITGSRVLCPATLKANSIAGQHKFGEEPGNHPYEPVRLIQYGYKEGNKIYVLNVDSPEAQQFQDIMDEAEKVRFIKENGHVRTL